MSNEIEPKQIDKKNVEVKNDGLIKKIAKTFFYDSPKEMMLDAYDKHVVPAIGNLICDIVNSFFRNSKRNGKRRYKEARSYDGFYRPKQGLDDDILYEDISYSRSTWVKKVRFKYREDAIFVLDTITEIADRSGFVSVADYYEQVGNDTEYTDTYYGWTREMVRMADVKFDGSKYYISLTKPTWKGNNS